MQFLKLLNARIATIKKSFGSAADPALSKFDRADNSRDSEKKTTTTKGSNPSPSMVKVTIPKPDDKPTETMEDISPELANNESLDDDQSLKVNRSHNFKSGNTA